MFVFRTEAAVAKISGIVDKTIAALFDSYRPSDRLLSRTARWLLLTILMLLCLVALPPLRDWIKCNYVSIPTNQEARETWKAWCDFVFIAAQLAILLVAGGVYFTDGLAEEARNRFNLYFEAKDQKFSDNDKAIRAQLEEYIGKLKELPQRVTWWNVGWKMVIVEWYFFKICRLLMRRLPRHVAMFLAVRLVRSWSGGAAGFVIFLVFLPWVGAPIVKTYFDYPAVCG